MEIDWTRLRVIAHRGASISAPENTLSSFKLAYHLGAPAIEFDVKLTKDQKIVVHHDSTVDRTSDGTGLINQMGFEQLRELDAGIRFSPSFKNERIPLLSEVFEEFGARIFYNIELTNYNSPFDRLVEETVKLIYRFSLQNNVIFSSFNYINLIHCRQLAPDIACGSLAAPGDQISGYASYWLPFQAYHPWIGDVNNGLITRAHKNKRRVFVWTVNDPLKMSQLKTLGVNGIITDDPKTGLESFL